MQSACSWVTPTHLGLSRCKTAYGSMQGFATRQGPDMKTLERDRTVHTVAAHVLGLVPVLCDRFACDLLHTGLVTAAVVEGHVPHLPADPGGSLPLSNQRLYCPLQACDHTTAPSLAWPTTRCSMQWLAACCLGAQRPSMLACLQLHNLYQACSEGVQKVTIAVIHICRAHSVTNSCRAVVYRVAKPCLGRTW